MHTVDAATEQMIRSVLAYAEQRLRLDPVPLDGGPRVKVLTQLPGVGPFTALVILAEVGDVSRSGSARKLAS